MKKKDIKLLFTAIRKHDNTVVRALLDRKPELVHATAAAPPKKDDGQSPLQVACKTGNVEVANVLIARGADVRFVEQSMINE